MHGSFFLRKARGPENICNPSPLSSRIPLSRVKRGESHLRFLTVPLSCCPLASLASRALAPGSVFWSPSLWLLAWSVWELRSQSQSLQSIALAIVALVG